MYPMKVCDEPHGACAGPVSAKPQRSSTRSEAKFAMDARSLTSLTPRVAAISSALTTPPWQGLDLGLTRRL